MERGGGTGGDKLLPPAPGGASRESLASKTIAFPIFPWRAACVVLACRQAS